MFQKILVVLVLCLFSLQLMAGPETGRGRNRRKTTKEECEFTLLKLETPKFPKGIVDTDDYRNDLYRVLYLMPPGLYKLSNPSNGSELQLQVSVYELNRASIVDNSIELIGPSIDITLYPTFEGAYQTESRYREKAIADVNTSTGWAEWKTLNFSKTGFIICSGVPTYEGTGIGYSCFEFVYKRGRLDSIKVTARQGHQPFRLKFEQFYFVNRFK